MWREIDGESEFEVGDGEALSSNVAGEPHSIIFLSAHAQLAPIGAARFPAR